MNIFYQAIKAPTVEEAITILELDTLDATQLEDLAWCFAFNNGDSQKAPTERESALATACLSQLEKLENEQ